MSRFHTDDQWQKAVREGRCSGWFKRAFWLDEWGPKPGEPRCHAPPELVEKYGGNKS